MSIFTARAGTIATLLSTILRPHFCCRALFLCAVLAATQLFAQHSVPKKSVPKKDASFYLNKYAQLLAQLQEARFKYSGSSTRSTSSKGIAGRWENNGIIRTSSARRSFHCTTAAALAMAGKPKKDLGICERLSTPDTFLDVSVAPKDVDNLQPAKVRNVDCNSDRRPEEWVQELQWHELATLLGYAPVGCDEKSLLELARQAGGDVLENQTVGSKNLSGFSVTSDGIEGRVLFDPSNHDRLAHVEVSRLGASTGPDDVVRATLNILEVRHTDSKPSFIKLKVTLELAGGIVKGSDLPEVPGAKRAESIEIEPQTWDYYYDLTDFQYQENPRDAWFALDHPIPNGTPADLNDDGNPSLFLKDRRMSYVWRDGKAEVAFIERLADAIRKVRPCGMRCLVILEGEAATSLVDDGHPDMLAYLPLVLDHHTIDANASDLAELGWLLPQAGETVLVAFDGDVGMLGTERLICNDADDATRRASAFLKTHLPPVRDARARLDAARAEAKRTDRKVCLVVSGPRCEPCFRLARWMDNQLALLEKDYVIVNVVQGLDQHAQEVINAFDGPPNGLPWFAITDAERKVLATSDGPLGNIGMPGSFEEVQHVREVLSKTAKRLSDDELDQLIESLIDFK